jgi:hypothetical protein
LTLSPEPGESPWEHVNAPIPRAASGRATAVGDEKAIRFGKGTIRVRVREVEPGRRLVADVVEQTIEQRALGLRTLTLECAPEGPQATRVAMTIDFVPRMGPRWCWRPYERFFGAIPFEAMVEAWREGVRREPLMR